jgi:hypothetical protein
MFLAFGKFKDKFQIFLRCQTGAERIWMLAVCAMKIGAACGK